jgi:DNA-binding NtrC family response regulator
VFFGISPSKQLHKPQNCLTWNALIVSPFGALFALGGRITPFEADTSMHLETVDFPTDGLGRLQRLVDNLSPLQLRVGTAHSTDPQSAWAVAMYFEEPPTEAQAEFVQRLALHKVPAIAVVAAKMPPGQRLEIAEAGFLGVISTQGLEGRLTTLLEMLISRTRIQQAEFAAKVREQVPAESEDSLLFCSPEVQELLQRLTRVASLGSTIMLTGETGVGKSSIARWIHEHSARSAAPFIDVPCAALPANLIESELFGHVRGSFTSADRDHTGKFKVAGKGTLLLDEVDCLPWDVQGKLLRAVERREFERVGATQTEKFEARLIVATNRPLRDEVEAGRFRSDLFYRLGVLSFRVPALRERAGAIRPLAEMFLTRFAKEHGRQVTGISPAAMGALEQYDWPGNIRELRNAIEYAVAICVGNHVQWSDIPEHVRQRSASEPAAAPGRSEPFAPRGAHGTSLATQHPVAPNVAMTEKDRLLHVLRKNGNNRSRAAQELGISRVTLYKRMERLGIDEIYVR